MKKKFNFKISKVLHKDESAQLFLLGGVTISLIIISLAVVSLEISSIDSKYKSSDSIKTDFDNICIEFGNALQDDLGSVIQYTSLTDYSIVEKYFYDIEDTFVFIEHLHNNDFDADCSFPNDLIVNPDGKILGIRIKLTLENDKEYITEVIDYYIEDE